VQKYHSIYNSKIGTPNTITNNHLQTTTQWARKKYINKKKTENIESTTKHMEAN
jgi:hypothetical protein